MSTESSHDGHALTFETWKGLLRIDCITQDKLRPFDRLGENVLRILYENGLSPTVEES